MKKEDMRCENCIFIKKYPNFKYCHLKPHFREESGERTSIEFPLISSFDWCGQGEWEGPDKNNPDITVLYRWGEWDAA
jgi:hypothetical protein